MSLKSDATKVLLLGPISELSVEIFQSDLALYSIDQPSAAEIEAEMSRLQSLIL